MINVAFPYGWTYLSGFIFAVCKKRLKNRKQAERFAHVDMGNYTPPLHFFSNYIIKNGLSIFFFFRYYENHKHGFCYMAVESQRGLLSCPLQQSSCSVTAAMFLEGPQWTNEPVVWYSSSSAALWELPGAGVCSPHQRNTGIQVFVCTQGVFCQTPISETWVASSKWQTCSDEHSAILKVD